MTVQELLKPRIIVENLYPNCPFVALEIICEPSAQQTEWANTYPYIFRWLKWYEERKESDMPEYVKDKTAIPKIIRKVQKHFTSFAPPDQIEWMEDVSAFISDGTCRPYWAMLPATKEDFLNQKTANV